MHSGVELEEEGPQDVRLARDLQRREDPADEQGVAVAAVGPQVHPEEPGPDGALATVLVHELEGPLELGRAQSTMSAAQRARTHTYTGTRNHQGHPELHANLQPVNGTLNTLPASQSTQRAIAL